MYSAAGKLPLHRVKNPEEARTAVDNLDNAGADFIKVLSSLTLDDFESVAQRARLRRIPFAGHVPDDVPLETALDARIRSMEHLYGILFAATPLERSLRPAVLEGGCHE